MDCRGCSLQLLNPNDLMSYQQGEHYHLVLKPEKLEPFPKTLKAVADKKEILYEESVSLAPLTRA
jgi:hypothetical protein